MVHTFDISNFDYQMKRIPSQRYMKSGRKDKNFTKLEFVEKLSSFTKQGNYG